VSGFAAFDVADFTLERVRLDRAGLRAGAVALFAVAGATLVFNDNFVDVFRR
jgi:hypothetical protein